MARPKADDPRSERVVARCTVSEKAAMEAGARDAGLSLSDYARRLLVGPVAPSRAAKVKARATVQGAKEAVGLPRATYRCPFGPGRCSFVAPSGKARCPVHGRTVVAS